MEILGTRHPFSLLVGDLLALLLSLYLSLLVRYFAPPSPALFLTHLAPFSLLFMAWIVVFYIAGLYERRTVILKSRLPSLLLNTLLANALISIVFFYFVPLFGITPKTILFIYLVISFTLISIWRFLSSRILGNGNREKALLIGSGKEVEELKEEINKNDVYNIRIVSEAKDASVIIVDMSHEEITPHLPDLYNLIFSGIRFIDLSKLYEDVFNREPLSVIRYNWFLENVSTAPRISYNILKRLMDIVLAAVLGVVSLAVSPFIILGIKLQDSGPIFYKQTRVGENNRPITMYKFRSMTGTDSGNQVLKSEHSVTPFGEFLRKSRLDELPQLWNVLRGDLSLIGPRPEFPALAAEYDKEIPYYHVRHLVKPGLSGWAQIYGEHGHGQVALEETRNKLAYDLYYVKNRSFLLDLKIALRTIQILLSRAGK